MTKWENNESLYRTIGQGKGGEEMDIYEEVLQHYRENSTAKLWKMICKQEEKTIDWENFCQTQKELFEGIEELMNDIQEKVAYYLAEEECDTPFAITKYRIACERLMFAGIPDAVLMVQTQGYVKILNKVLHGKAADRLYEKLNQLDAIQEKLQGEKKLQFKAALCNIVSLWGNAIISIDEVILGRDTKSIKSLIRQTVQQTESARKIIKLAGATEEDITEFVKAYIAFGCPLVSV